MMLVPQVVLVAMFFQVVLVAMFFALLWKKPDIEEDDRPKHLKPNEEWLQRHMTAADMQNPEKRKLLKRCKAGPVHFSQEYLKACREERSVVACWW